VVIDALAAGTLTDPAKAVLMLGAPETMSLLAGPIPPDQATQIIRALPLEVAAPLRDLTVPHEAAVAAVLTAHMIIFWLSQDSNVTPPVALASFTAAAIAKSPAMATGVASWKLAKGLYIVPVIMAYTPFLSGNWPVAFAIFAVSVFGIYAIAGAIQGCLERPVGWPMRAALLVAGIACVWPSGWILNIAAVLAVIALVAANLRWGKVPDAPSPA
jgi:TRAP-type uncharacterized transport system fused permease subunit